MQLARFALMVAAAALLAGCAGTGVEPVVVSTDPAAQSLSVAGPPAQARAAAPNMPRLRKELQEYLEDQDGTCGVYILDLATGKAVGINGDQVFPAASTLKLPMALYILDQVAKGKANLEEQIAYSRGDYEDGTGTLQEWIKVGDKLKVRELIELAITQSDNIATQMLLRRFGVENVYEYMRRLGGTVTHYDEGVPGTTPKEMANYMKNVQSSAALRDPKLRQFLLRSLEQTAFEDRTAAGVPEGVAVAHKIGTLPGVVNDVALVEAPGHPFIIAAFSRDVDDEVAPAVITEVTRKVYAFLVAS